MANNISYQTAEYGKFLQLGANTAFPPISVVRLSYPDTSSAFPSNSGLGPLSSVDIYPKYAVLTHITNPEDISFTVYLSAENISVELGQIEQDVHEVITLCNVMTAQNVELNSYVNDLEKNTFDTASAVDDVFWELKNIKENGVKVSFNDNATIDAFQRLRISEPVTLFDSKQLHQMSTLFWSNTSLNGNIYHTGALDPSITLSVSANGGYAIRQTTQRFNYQSGKSMLYMFTGILNPETNITKRYGCFASLTAAPFEPNVGLYFEASNGTIHCVQNNTGFLVPSVSASRNEWNIDKLDGTGPSGQTLTLSGTNIFVIDYEWLGVGRVRYGVVLDGQVWYCHKINNTGKAGAYLMSPNHPIRAELRQTGAGSGSMKMICSTVISEGGSDFSGVTRSIDSGTSLTVGSGTRRAILGVRLQYNKLDSVNQIINASVICIQQSASTQAPYRYELVLNPQGISGGTWTDIVESNFQRWRGNVTPTADTGFVLAEGFGSVGANIDLGTFNLKKFLRLGTSVHGVRDELYLVVTPLGANDGVYGSLSFIESD